jgi:hypothetical protein
MPTAQAVESQINGIVGFLVESGLASDQNYAFRRDGSEGRIEVTFPQAHHVYFALRDRDYSETYEHLVSERSYNALLPDGALLQMMYIFVQGELESHRLAFFPAPHLEDFQANPESYMEGEVYADVVGRKIVPFPIRFDFDSREGVHAELTHPKSHLTLGQYEDCRIPLSAGMTPFWFVDFILRNFYNTAFRSFSDRLPRFAEVFVDSILASERGIVHVQLPVQRGASVEGRTKRRSSPAVHTGRRGRNASPHVRRPVRKR